MNKEQRLKEIEKGFLKIALIDAVPMLMIGLGLYAKFSGDKEPIFEFLKNDLIVNGLFVVAVPVVVWCMFKSFQLAIERARLGRSED